MCNANHHPLGCTCGWGGVGCSHGGRVGFRGYSVPSHSRRWGYGYSRSYSGKSNMAEMAAALGHSLLFPVFCRHCGQHIYLFAAPDGGFAVFDEPGRPWPQHDCGGFSQPEVTFREPRSTRYQLPVPDSLVPCPPKRYHELSGVVVGLQVRTHPRRIEPIWSIDIYDGKLLYHIQVETQFRVGSYVRGVVGYRPDLGTILDNAIELNPPSRSAPRPRKRSRSRRRRKRD
jgi:hypothetical protein